MSESADVARPWDINEFIASSKTIAQNLYDIYQRLGLVPPPEVYAAIERTLGVSFEDLVGVSVGEFQAKLAECNAERAALIKQVDELQDSVVDTVADLRNTADRIERTLPRRLRRRY